MSETTNLVSSTQEIIHEALDKLGFDESMYELVKEPLRLLTVRIPVRMDDGTVKHLQATVHSITTLLVLLKVGCVSIRMLMKRK